MAENYATTTGTLPGYNENGSPKLNTTMQLFGLPYQFLPSVDQRHPSVSNVIGRKFADNIVMDSTVVTIIPGKPKYLPSVPDKKALTNALIDATNDSFSAIKNYTNFKNDELRLYDFQSDFTGYYSYVNVLCHISAGFYELGEQKDTSDGEGFRISGNLVNFLKNDWKDYRWDGQPYHSTIGGIARSAGNAVLTAIVNAGSKLTSAISGGKISFGDEIVKKDSKDVDKAENLIRQSNFIQFYVEADSSKGNESLTNNTQPSMFKSMLDQGSSAMRDVAFLANSAGIDTKNLDKLGSAALDEINKVFGDGQSVPSAVSGILGRIMSTGKSVVKGENIIMPDIWSGSQNSKSYELVFKFKAMYGNRLSNFVDCIVPTLHCVALAYPRGTTANAYKSPPLVKVYKRGEWTCNMGMITGFELEKSENSDAFNVDSAPMEITVRMQITDLYTDMILTPPNNVALFASNSSLIEFLATTCGLDLVQPKLGAKISTMWNMTVSGIQSTPRTALSRVAEAFDRAILSHVGL